MTDLEKSLTLAKSLLASKVKLLEAAAVAIDIAQRDYLEAGNLSEHWESQNSSSHFKHLLDHIGFSSGGRGGGSFGEDHDAHLVIRALMYYYKVIQEENRPRGE